MALSGKASKASLHIQFLEVVGGLHPAGLRRSVLFYFHMFCMGLRCSMAGWMDGSRCPCKQCRKHTESNDAELPGKDLSGK